MDERNTNASVSLDQSTMDCSREDFSDEETGNSQRTGVAGPSGDCFKAPFSYSRLVMEREALICRQRVQRRLKHQALIHRLRRNIRLRRKESIGQLKEAISAKKDGNVDRMVETRMEEAKTSYSLCINRKRRIEQRLKRQSNFLRTFKERSSAVESKTQELLNKGEAMKIVADQMSAEMEQLSLDHALVQEAFQAYLTQLGFTGSTIDEYKQFLNDRAARVRALEDEYFESKETMDKLAEKASSLRVELAEKRKCKEERRLQREEMKRQEELERQRLEEEERMRREREEEELKIREAEQRQRQEEEENRLKLEMERQEELRRLEQQEQQRQAAELAEKERLAQEKMEEKRKRQAAELAEKERLAKQKMEEKRKRQEEERRKRMEREELRRLEAERLNIEKEKERQKRLLEKQEEEEKRREEELKRSESRRLDEQDTAQKKTTSGNSNNPIRSVSSWFGVKEKRGGGGASPGFGLAPIRGRRGRGGRPPTNRRLHMDTPVSTKNSQKTSLLDLTDDSFDIFAQIE